MLNYFSLISTGYLTVDAWFYLSLLVCLYYLATLHNINICIILSNYECWFIIIRLDVYQTTPTFIMFYLNGIINVLGKEPSN